MTQIAVRDDLIEKAVRLTDGKYPLEQLAEFAFRGYTDVLSIKGISKNSVSFSRCRRVALYSLLFVMVYNATSHKYR